MYESDRRRAAPLTSLYMQRTPAARAVSPRMARTDAIQRPVEPPNPPIVESAQPVLPLGGAPIQARSSKPERIARRTSGAAIAAMEFEVNHAVGQPSGEAFGENENNPPPEPEAVGRVPAARRPGFWERTYAEDSVPGGIQFFRNHYLSLEGAVREDCRAAIATHIGRVPTRDEVQDNLARGVTGFNAHRHPLFGGWAHGRCVQTPLHAFSTAVGLQARTDNLAIFKYL